MRARLSARVVDLAPDGTEDHLVGGDPTVVRAPESGAPPRDAPESSAAALFERAQAIADELTRESAAEARKATEDARRWEADARRAHEQAERARSEAERLRQQAEQA